MGSSSRLVSALAARSLLLLSDGVQVITELRDQPWLAAPVTRAPSQLDLAGASLLMPFVSALRYAR